MRASLEAVMERLDRLERVLVGGAVAEVRTLSVDDVERLTGLPRPAVLAAIRTGDLPSIAVGPRTKVVRPRDLDDWLDRLERRETPG